MTGHSPLHCSRRRAWMLVLALCLVGVASCRDHVTHDIVIDRLRIADLHTDDEITHPSAGQRVGLEMFVKTPGVTDMVRYVFSLGDSVIDDFHAAAMPEDHFARSGFEIVMPQPGAYVFRVIADPEDLIDEAHEDNNEAALTVT